MKKITFLFTFFIFFFAFSQTKDFVIKWDGTKTLSTETSSLEVPYFNKESFNFSVSNGLTFFSQWETDLYINENTVKLVNVNYVPISVLDLKDVKQNTIPNKVQFSLKNSVARNEHSVLLELSPIINDKGVFKKVTSFAVQYDSSRDNRNSFNSQVITNSVLNQGEWYKFYIDTTGVFRLSKTFLSNLGINVNSVDPRNIKLY